MVDPRHSAHKLWDKTAIVTSHMTESKQEGSCGQDQHGDAASGNVVFSQPKSKHTPIGTRVC